MKPVSEIISGMAQFTGTENYFRHCSGLLYTDGVQWIAQSCEAYWLLDLIGSCQVQCRQDPMLLDMQFWHLHRAAGASGAVVTCERDKGDVAIRQEIPYTDFPLPEIDIWVEAGVILLPSEH